ncbi:MAG: heparan-alpha-glucosaminide N-acetyltransferase domain-containing protein [Acidimicrobiales bacterium]
MTTALLDPNPHTAAVTPSEPEARRPAAGGRVAAIDIARGVALLGMFTVHVPSMAERPNGAWDWILEAPSGRAAVLFFMLSGVSLSLISRKGSRSAEPSVLVARGAVLLLFGLVMTQFWFGSSILVQYGLVFLVAPWLFRRSARTLLALAAGTLLVGPVVVEVLGINASSWISTHAEITTGWLGQTIASAFLSTHALVVWLGFFCIGLLVGRADLTRRRNAARTLGIGLALGAAATVGILSTDHLVETYDDESFYDKGFYDKGFSDADGLGAGSDVSGLAADGSLGLDGEGSAFASSFPTSGSFVSGSDFDSGSFFMDGGSMPFEWTDPVWSNLLSGESHSNMTPWALQSAGIALAVIGLPALLPGAVTRLLSPLGALGSISLTAYVFHPVLVQDVWTWTDPISASFTWEIVRLAIAMALLVALGWVVKRRWKQGPLEWALHRLSAPSARP